jgi:hypothetical protein
MDAAFIRLKNTGVDAFIYENGNHYYPGDQPDNNKKVGIIEYLTPTSKMIGTIVYKSGKTTGVTYGKILRIDYNWTPNSNKAIYPTILITRCPDNQCYNDDYIAHYEDSGGVVYIRDIIYAQRIDGPYDYGTKVIGILNGKSNYDTKFIEVVASWAAKVKDKWPELNISFVICGLSYSPSCR